MGERGREESKIGGGKKIRGRGEKEEDGRRERKKRKGGREGECTSMS